MRDQRKLLVAQRARELALAVYRLTAVFPPEERYGLTAQMRRSAVSVGSNIAEGAGRSGDREFLRFVHIAYGSASELAFQLTLAIDLGFTAEADCASTAGVIDQIQRMLNGLSKHLRSQPGNHGAIRSRR
ncbi:MAG TPA: four helix bundle protein [Gemmatimonadaceae bacterium]|nr:four helix bundle protein [Gemmatimonadaceae bacterium]